MSAARRPTTALAVTLVAALVTAGLVLAGCQGPASGGGAPGSTSPAATSSDVTSPDVDPSILPTRQVATTTAMRLTEGLSPPTNRWFSALALGESAQPVFPLPLAVGLTDGGFGVSVPALTTTATGVMGPYVPDVTVDAAGADPVVTGYDAASVTVDLGTGRLTVVEGSPALHWTATSGGTVSWDAAFTPGGPAGSAVAEVGERTWLLLAFTPDGDPVEPALADDGRSAQVPAGGHLAWLALPDGVAATAAAATTLAQAVRPAAATTVAWGTDDAAATTAIDFGTSAAVVRLPTQATPASGDDLDCDGLGSYATVLGEATACAGRTASWSVPAVDVAATLDLSALTGAERAELTDVVTADAATATAADAAAYPADTYYGGKALARDAQLLTLATQLGLDAPAAALRERVGDELRTRADPDGCTTADERCFVFDPVLGTVVGLPTAFGSEEANDHHFHYGYFLQAAALAAADDAEHGDGTLADDLAPVIDLLAVDIAAAGPIAAGGGGGAGIPALRVFDAFAGHSWASGFAPFADGNNQESTSEAVAAWHGLALWADVRGDAALGTQARWLLASEAASARAYWLEPAQGPTSFTSLLWGGKREQATWFSPEATAALAIQVLPVIPASGYLAGPGGTVPDGGEHIRANLAEALGVDADHLWADLAVWDVAFGDQLLAYAALAGADDAAQAAAVLRDLPVERIDDGATRSWLLAWALTR